MAIGRRTGLQSTGQNASDPGYFCRKSCIGRGKDPGRTGSAQIPGIPSVGTGKITVKTGRRNRYKEVGRKKAEMDRRLIRERISRLKKELADVERHRELLRSQRNQSGMKVAALVGYTSAGKSSIENALTNAGDF